MNEIVRNILLIAIFLPPFLTGFFSRGFKRRLGRHGRNIPLVTSGLSLGVTIIVGQVILRDGPIRNYIFYVDTLSLYFILLVNLVAFFSAFYVPRYLGAAAQRDDGEKASVINTQNRFHYFVKWLDHFLSSENGFLFLFGFFHASMLLVSMMDSLAGLWFFVAATTVISTPLVGYERTRKAQEAALKYVMISSAGILFALLGTILLVSAFSGEQSLDWSIIRADLLTPEKISVRPSLVKLAFLFVVLGYGTKAGFFPMHTWLPDAHGQAPFPVSALLSGVLLKSGFYAILRFYSLTNIALGDSGEFASFILLLFGLISLVFAVPFIIKRRYTNQFKRILAYHSLEHMGIIAFGVGLGVELAFIAALFHVLNHALTKALMFLIYGQIKQAHEKAKVPEGEIRGIFHSLPISGFILALGGIALVGAPPFNIFLSEFLILWSAVEKSVAEPNYLIYFIAAFLLSVILIFAGLVNHLGRIALGENQLPLGREKAPESFVLLILLMMILFFGFTLWPLTTLLEQSAMILCGGGLCS